MRLDGAPASQARAQYDQYGQQIKSPSPDEDASPIYLVALKGGVVYAASSYKIADGTVRYVTVEGQQKQTPLTGVDRDLTLRLNRQRGVSFNLPQ